MTVTTTYAVYIANGIVTVYGRDYPEAPARAFYEQCGDQHRQLFEEWFLQFWIPYLAQVQTGFYIPPVGVKHDLPHQCPSVPSASAATPDENPAH